MKRPEPSKLWEVAVRFPGGSWGPHILTLKNDVIPLIKTLKKEAGVKWYSFMVHDSKNGVPIKYHGPQYHIQFENSNGLTKKKLLSVLPGQAEGLRKVPEMERIQGVDAQLVRGADLRNALKLMGEASEWLVHLLENTDMDSGTTYHEWYGQFSQFLHFISNGIQVEALLVMKEEEEDSS